MCQTRDASSLRAFARLRAAHPASAMPAATRAMLDGSGVAVKFSAENLAIPAGSPRKLVIRARIFRFAAHHLAAWSS